MAAVRNYHKLGDLTEVKPHSSGGHKPKSPVSVGVPSVQGMLGGGSFPPPQLGTAQPGFPQWSPSARLPSPEDTSSWIEGPTLSPGRCHPEILNLMTSPKTLFLNNITSMKAWAQNLHTSLGEHSSADCSHTQYQERRGLRR